MQIGLLGYGKMGKAIEKIALQRGHEIAWRVTSENRAAVNPAFLQKADVVIEFSKPEFVYNNVMQCIEARVPVICGTTGWQQNLEQAKTACLENNAAFLWASNFSLGVNLFFELNKNLAKMLEKQTQYAPNITEIHHIHKLDAPSGTAITLAENLISENGNYANWQLVERENVGDTHPVTLSTHPVTLSHGVSKNVPIKAIREAEVPGTHSVIWQSEMDEIEIKHSAYSREGFALGAVVAAEWILGKRGVFSMRDLLFG